MEQHGEVLSLEDEKEVALFGEILELEPERRKRLVEAVQAYDLVVTHGEKLFGGKPA